jgi:hypothetical protein
MAMSTIVGQFKDATNPFVRLITTATTEDGNMNVPYYQIEEIREAAFQSDYACDSIHRALMQRLEYFSYPFIVSKSLCLIRVLMLEGPASFNHKMGAASGRLLHIINDSNEVRKNTVEERNKLLAGAIHQAISGDSKALVNFGDPNGPRSNAPPKASTTAGGTSAAAPSHKSEFQLQQEREQRNHRKRLEEEKRGGAMVVSDRLLDTFDGTLTPIKLVESVTSSPKKKFAPEEIDSFVSAAMQTEKVAQVCAALDAVLRDGKASLQNRFKVLGMVEALTSGSSDAQQYFKSHPLGWQRHLSIERVDNPAKAEAAKSVAQRIAAMVVNAVPQIQSAVSARPRGSSTAVAPGSSSLGGSFSSSQQQQQQQAKPSATQWEWNGPSVVPTSALGNMDDLFSNMSVRSAGPPVLQQQQQQNSVSNTTTTNQFWNTTAAPQQQQQQQQQQFQQPQYHQQQFQPQPQLPPQQQQQQQYHYQKPQQQLQPSFVGFPSPALAYQTPAVPNNSMVFSYSNSELPPAPNNSFVALPPPQQQPQQQVEESPPSQADVLRRQMEEFQQTMMRMLQQAQQQQQQQPNLPPAAAVTPPPQPPVVVRTPPPPPVSQDSGTIVAVPAEASSAAGGAPNDVSDGEEEAASQSSAPVASPPPPVATTPAVAPVANEAAIAMMLQLQQQMEATQRMLAQQQAAFQALSAQVLGTAPPPS